MEDPSKSFAATTPAPAPSGCAPSEYALPERGPLDSASQLREDCRLARAARVNLLVIHGEAVVQDLLEWLMLDLQHPIATPMATPMATLRTGERLVLPPVAWARTMILQDVGALTRADQHCLLDWLDRAAGRTQVVSATPASLWPRVQAGAFIDKLYYRLNTVCMDVSGYLADIPRAGVSGRTNDRLGSDRLGSDHSGAHFGGLAAIVTAQSQ
jgi:hypothetical protein